MSEVLACAVAKQPRFLCSLQDSKGVQARQHESIAHVLRPIEGQTGLPRTAYAKLSFSMEGVSERVVPGEGYWLLSAAYLRSELCW